MINRISSTDSMTQTSSNETLKRFTVDSFQSSVDIPKVIMDQSESNSSAPLNLEQHELPAEKVQKITDSLNKLLEATSTKLRYKYHEKLDKYYVTLVNSQTDEVVREIPNKKLMDIYAAMLDFVGVFVDEKI